MDLIYTDKNKKDIDVFLEYVDFESGDETTKNNFKIASSTLGAGYWLYAPGTEWGGRVEYMEKSTSSSIPVWMGHTFRGLMMQDIIEPLKGNDYRVVSGEANEIIRELFGGLLDGFFTVPDKDSGLTIDSYQFPLYVRYGTGVMDMLKEYGYRLYIHAEKENPGKPFAVYAEAVPNKTISGYFNEDSKIPMTFINDQMGFTHLVCLGSGQLQERQRVDLYLQEDGSIGTTPFYTGFYKRTEYYNNTSVESLEQLEKEGRKHFKEVMQKKVLQMYLSDADYEIGDVIVGIDNENHLRVEKPIIGKILRKTRGKEEIEYKAGD